MSHKINFWRTRNASYWSMDHQDLTYEKSMKKKPNKLVFRFYKHRNNGQSSI